MQLIRAVHIKHHYDENKQRFISSVFKNYNGGISVFDEACAIAKSGGVCVHILKYYSRTVGDPILFCRIDQNAMIAFEGFEKVSLEKTLSDSNDDCHIDICGANEKKCKDFAKSYFKYPNIFVCCKGTIINLTNENIENLNNFIAPCREENNDEYFN